MHHIIYLNTGRDNLFGTASSGIAGRPWRVCSPTWLHGCDCRCHRRHLAVGVNLAGTLAVVRSANAPHQPPVKRASLAGAGALNRRVQRAKGWFARQWREWFRSPWQCCPTALCNWSAAGPAARHAPQRAHESVSSVALVSATALMNNRPITPWRWGQARTARFFGLPSRPSWRCRISARQYRPRGAGEQYRHVIIPCGLSTFANGHHKGRYGNGRRRSCSFFHRCHGWSPTQGFHISSNSVGGGHIRFRTMWDDPQLLPSRLKPDMSTNVIIGVVMIPFKSVLVTIVRCVNGFPPGDGVDSSWLPWLYCAPPVVCAGWA